MGSPVTSYHHVTINVLIFTCTDPWGSLFLGHDPSVPCRVPHTLRSSGLGFGDSFRDSCGMGTVGEAAVLVLSAVGAVGVADAWGEAVCEVVTVGASQDGVHPLLEDKTFINYFIYRKTRRE